MPERCTQEELDELFLLIFPPEKRPPPSSKYQSRKPGRSRLYDKERDDLIVWHIVPKLHRLTLDQLNEVNELADQILLLKRINKP